MRRTAAVVVLIAALSCATSTGVAQQTGPVTTAPTVTLTIPAPAQPPKKKKTRKAKPAPPSKGRTQTIGRSVEGRAIRLTVVGNANAARKVLVVGCIHGSERAGEAIVRRLAPMTPPPGAALYLIRQFNPDGCAAGTRGNANGVDLNRNSPWHWKRLKGTYYSGRRPLSEPESKAINRLVRRIKPNVSIWYHQHADLVDTSLGDIATKSVYSQMTGVPLRDFGTRPGSITSWQKSKYPSSVPIVVELPAGSLSYTAVGRHVRAVLALAASP